MVLVERGRIANAVNSKSIHRVRELVGSIIICPHEEKLRDAALNRGNTEKDYDVLRAWLKAKFPLHFEQLEGKSRRDLNLLLDENIPYYMAPILHRYGYVSSVFMEQWQGKKDKFLFGYAGLMRGFHAIITRDVADRSSRAHTDDPDLTTVARMSWSRHFRSDQAHSRCVDFASLPKHPVLVQLTGEHPHRDGTANVFEKRFYDIANWIESRKYAAIEVTARGAHPNNDLSLVNIWRSVHAPVPSPGEYPPPKDIAKVIRVTKRCHDYTAMFNERTLENVRLKIGQACRDLAFQGEKLDLEDILKILECVMGEIHSNIGESQKRLSHDELQEQKELALLELLMRSAAKFFKTDTQTTGPVKADEVETTATFLEAGPSFRPSVRPAM